MEKVRAKKLMFGNQAVVQGALEAGLNFSSSFPGTPASEIADTLAKISKNQGIYFEYSVNEKVALEVAAGAAFSGLKAMVSFKHYGLNVAIDSLLPLVYLSCPLVVVISDDPGSWSSVQAEQDSRHYSQFAKLPTLEPSNAQEAKDMTKAAFELAEKYQIPILVRLTTRVALSRSLVNINPTPKQELVKGKFQKPKNGFKITSQNTVKLHQQTLDKIELIKKEISEHDQFNIIKSGSGKQGVIASGVSYQYLEQILKDLDLDIPVFKIGMSYPLPENRLNWFIQNLDTVLVLEELDPIIEQKIKTIAKAKVAVLGKEILPEIGEFKPEQVRAAIAKLINKPISTGKLIDTQTAKRTPYFCPGCPHRASFYAIKKALGKDKIYGGDIGCYMLGNQSPYQLIDYVVAMGAGLGVTHGIAKTNDQKPVVFIGDSTFFHAGIPALINMVFNQSDILVIILDNRFTAMTGQQPNPGTGENAGGDKTKAIKIEEIAQAVGVDNLKVVNVYNLKQTKTVVKELYDKKGVSVLVAKGECRLAMLKRLRKQGKDFTKYQVVKKQKTIPKSLQELQCPAIQIKDQQMVIDQTLCSGCAVCKQIEPDLIAPKLEKEKTIKKKE